MAGAGALSADDVAKRADATPVSYANGSTARSPAGSSDTKRRTTPTSCRPRRRWRSPTTTRRSSCARGMNAFASMFMDIDKITSAFRGDGATELGRPPPLPVLRHRMVLPHRLPRRAWRPSGSRPSTASTRSSGRREGRRRRLRSRRVGRRHGRRVPQVEVLRLRLPRAVDRDVARTGGRGGRVEADDVRGRVGEGLRRQVRPHLLLRLPARHGRPGRHRPATPASTSPTTARCCSSSRSPSRVGRRTSPRTRWPRCSTPRRRRSARRTRCRRRSDSASAPRPDGASARGSREAGFTRFRVAAETPMNLVIEARP